MSGTSVELVRQGIAAYQAGDTIRARELLKQAVAQDPSNQSAWLWLSGVVNGSDECVYCLNRVIHIDPKSDAAKHARNGLAQMAHTCSSGTADTRAADARVAVPSDDAGVARQYDADDNADDNSTDEHVSQLPVSRQSSPVIAGARCERVESLPSHDPADAVDDSVESLPAYDPEQHQLAVSSDQEVSENEGHSVQPLSPSAPSLPSSSSSSSPPPAPRRGNVQRPLSEQSQHPPAEKYTIDYRHLKVMDHNVTVMEQAESANTTVEILHYNSLDGSDDIESARNLFYVQQVGMRLKQVKITLYGGEVVLEAGALHFMKGNVTAVSSLGGIGGFFRKVASRVLTRETTFKPHYKGIGEIYLEPSFGHFIITYLNDEHMVVDSGMFYASEASVDVGVAMQTNVSSAVFGGEGLFQTRLSGTGWCVLASPVPSNEIVRYQLNNERLLVDGNFALLRKGEIDFSVQKSTRTLVGSLSSGEGLLQTFSGTGEVWLAPTQDVYKRIKLMGFADLTATRRDMKRRRRKMQ